LTWRSHLGFVYERSSFRLLREFRYPTEGWGITHDDRTLIMSDGTSTLRLLDPRTFEAAGELAVRDGATPVPNLNELEYVQGEIYANVWRTPRIARISRSTGQVTGWVDLSGLLSSAESRNADVLNGIAYDPEGDRLLVTGKLWPKLFEIKLVPSPCGNR
jgi:glutamine cyclotransferase